MKKGFSLLFLSALSISALVGCNKNTTQEDLNAAVDYLKATYGETTTTTANFKLVSEFKIEEKVFSVAWSVAIDADGLQNAVKVGETVDRLTTIEVIYDDSSIKESKYTVTGVVSDVDGNTTNVEFRYVVPEYKFTTFAEFMELADAATEDTYNVKGTVIAKYKSGVYLVDDDGYGYYAYLPKDYNQKTSDYKVGSLVKVAGQPTKYSGQYEFAKDCTVTKISDNDNYNFTYRDATAAFTSGNGIINYQNALAEIKNVTIADIDTSNYYYYFTVGTQKYYLRTSTSFTNYLTNDLFTDAECKEIVKDWVSSYKADVKGLVSIYNNNYYITPLTSDAVTITDKTLSDEKKAEQDATTALSSLKNSYASSKSIDLATSAGEDGFGSTISYSVSGDGAQIVDGKLVITPAADDQTFTITATGTLNDKEGSFDKTIKVLALQSGEKNINLTSGYLELGSYADGTATIGGVEFGFVELGDYGNGIQMRTNKESGVASKIFNNGAFTKPIKSIELTYNSEKSTYDNADAFTFAFGNAADALNYTTTLSTAAGTKTYTVTPDAETYTYFSMSLNLSYSFYWDSIKVVFEEEADVPAPDVSKVSLNSTNLGLGAYADGNATIDGAEISWIQLGYFGNGIQMRNKNGNPSKIFNSVAFAKPIKSIELVYNSEKDTYDNANAFTFAFGNAADALDYTTTLSMVAGTKTYTITPDVETYTYFSMTLVDTHSFYWDSIEIVFAD